MYHYKWPPEKIESLYCDDIDFFGLKWHYDFINEESDKIKAAMGGKKN